MRQSGFRPRPARRLAIVALLMAVAAASGCAGERAMRPFSGKPEGATIGRDLRALPRGAVAPQTGLGVDLVWTAPRTIDLEELKS